MTTGFAGWIACTLRRIAEGIEGRPKQPSAQHPALEARETSGSSEDLPLEMLQLLGLEPLPDDELPLSESDLEGQVCARWPAPLLLEGDPLLHELLVPSHPQWSELSYLLTKPWPERRASCEARPSCPVHDSSWSGTDGLHRACRLCLSHH